MLGGVVVNTAEGLVNTLSEVNWLSMLGGGVGIHVDIRSADDKSVGVMPHLKIYDAADRESFLTSAERKDRGREGKPMLGGVVVNTLSMSRVTCECFCYRCKAFLRALLFFLHVTFTKAFTRNFS